MMKQKSCWVVVSQTPSLSYVPLLDQQPWKRTGFPAVLQMNLCFQIRLKNIYLETTRAGLTCATTHYELVNEKSKTLLLTGQSRQEQAFAPLQRCCHKRKCPNSSLTVSMLTLVFFLLSSTTGIFHPLSPFHPPTIEKLLLVILKTNISIL